MSPNQSSIPPPVLSSLYDFTGMRDHLGRGYFLAHTGEKGDISIVVQVETGAIRSSLLSSAISFLENEKDFGASSIPPSILEKIGRFTGEEAMGCGYILFHTNESGDISIVDRSGSPAIKSALISVLASFVDKETNSSDFS